MKQYSKPEIISSSKPVFAFPAVGLALIGGYAAGKAVTKIFEASMSARENLLELEPVIS
ncbi:MAG: hypothetical protein IJT21_03405 [Synergistaceae bacterium]|nr:hypothetical protein [Synergistaceae bacterium]